MSALHRRGLLRGAIWGLGVAVVLSAVARAGVDVNVDPDPTPPAPQPLHEEISLAVVPGTQPGQPQIMLAAYNDDAFPGGRGLGVSYSLTYGATWVGIPTATPGQLPYPTPTVPPPPAVPTIPLGTTFNWAFDPTATWGYDPNPPPGTQQVNLYVGHIAVDGNVGGANGLYVWRSGDGGQTWAQAAVSEAGPASPLFYPDFNYRFNDRCQITADRFQNSQYMDNVYIAWIQDRGYFDQSNPPLSLLPEGDIYFSRSTDGGVTWTNPPLQLTNPAQPEMGNMPIPRVAANGTVYVSWLDYNLWNFRGQGTINLVKSTDGGQSFPTRWQGPTIELPPLRVFQGGGLTMDALAKGAPVLATSPNTASDLYIVYAADPDRVLNPDGTISDGPDDADIFLIKGVDSGLTVTWSQPWQVNTDTTQNDQILPWIDVKPDGRIDIAWYDRRNDPADILWDVYVAQVRDMGTSFSLLNEFALNDQSFRTAQGGTRLGEYPGLAVDSGYGYAIWTTTVNDPLGFNGDIYFDKFANAQQEVIPEPSTLVLLLAGSAALAAFGWKRRRRR